MSENRPITGYAEGYYGRLLSWQARTELVSSTAGSGWNTYLYAPKDDALHRSSWRTPYPAAWRSSFRQFTQAANAVAVDVIAGIAPGLDFDFADIDKTSQGSDFQALAAKALQMIDDGAAGIVLMFDDIDAGFPQRAGGFEFEGEAHATLANQLLETLATECSRKQTSVNNTPLCSCVPRIYANELIDSNDTDLLGDGDKQRNRRYLNDFLTVLETEIAWFYCGDAIVARSPSMQDMKVLLSDVTTETIGVETHRGIIWDNYFANDYCPRRLFLGPWSGRENCKDIVINPTGLPATDALIMTMVATERSGLDSNNSDESGNADARKALWHECLRNAQVPDSFLAIAHYFRSPEFSSGSCSDSDSPGHTAADRTAELNALNELLWRWKSPLALEWYPYLLGLKQDLLLQTGELSEMRIRKLQTAPLAHRLLD